MGIGEEPAIAVGHGFGALENGFLADHERRESFGDRKPAMRSDRREYQTHGRDTKHQWFPHFA